MPWIEAGLSAITKTFGYGSFFSTRGPQVLVHVSTYQGSILGDALQQMKPLPMRMLHQGRIWMANLSSPTSPLKAKQFASHMWSCHGSIIGGVATQRSPGVLAKLTPFFTLEIAVRGTKSDKTAATLCCIQTKYGIVYF